MKSHIEIPPGTIHDSSIHWFVDFIFTAFDISTVLTAQELSTSSKALTKMVVNDEPVDNPNRLDNSCVNDEARRRGLLLGNAPNKKKHKFHIYSYLLSNASIHMLLNDQSLRNTRDS